MYAWISISWLLFKIALWNASKSWAVDVTKLPYWTSNVFDAPIVISDVLIVVLSIAPLSMLTFVKIWWFRSVFPVNVNDEILGTFNSLSVSSYSNPVSTASKPLVSV